MAAGRDLMANEPLADGPLRVWYVNGEEDRDELDRGVGERLVEVERLLAWDPEDVLDALRLETLDEDVRSFARRHPGSFSRMWCRAMPLWDSVKLVNTPMA